MFIRFLENRENIVSSVIFLTNHLAEFGITKVLLPSARAENDQRTLKEGSIEQILKYSTVCLVEPWKQTYFWLLAYSPVTSSVTNNRACYISALIMKNLAEAPVVQQTGFNSSKLSCSLAKSNQISALLSALLIKYPPQAHDVVVYLSARSQRGAVLLEMQSWFYRDHLEMCCLRQRVQAEENLQFQDQCHHMTFRMQFGTSFPP